MCARGLRATGLLVRACTHKRALLVREPVYVRACVRACVRAFLRACVLARARARLSRTRSSYP